jgi:hypothetical protein
MMKIFWFRFSSSLKWCDPKHLKALYKVNAVFTIEKREFTTSISLSQKLTIEMVVSVYNGSIKSVPNKRPMMNSGSNVESLRLVASDYKKGYKLTCSSMFSSNTDPFIFPNNSESQTIPTNLLHNLNSLVATASNVELCCLTEGSSLALAKGSFFKSPIQVLTFSFKHCNF